MRTLTLMLIALMTVPAGVLAQTVPGIPPVGFLRTAIAREAVRAAQTPAEEDAWAVLRRLSVGSRVTLTLTSGQDVTGTVVEIQPDAVVLRSLDTRGKDLVLPASALRPDGAIILLRSTLTRVGLASVGPGGKKARHPVRNAFLIGAAAGAASAC